MRSLAVFAALPLLAACHFDAHAPGKSEKVEINADADGQVAFDLPFAKGQMKLPGNMVANSDIDVDGVKLMPGSKVTGFSVRADEGKDTKVDIGFSTPQPPAEVRDYFLAEFAKKDAKATDSGGTLAFKTRDGDNVDVAIAAEGDGSKGTITIRSKD